VRAAPKAFGVGSGFESRPTHSLNLIGGLQRLSHRRCHTFANQEVEIDRPAFAMSYAPASCKPGLLSPSHLVAGGLSAARYCASNARKADSMVIPKPAIPLRTLGPRSATQVPERWKNFGLGFRDAQQNIIPLARKQQLAVKSLPIFFSSLTKTEIVEKTDSDLNPKVVSEKTRCGGSRKLSDARTFAREAPKP